jgi:hypothetical protein
MKGEPVLDKFRLMMRVFLPASTHKQFNNGYQRSIMKYATHTRGIFSPRNIAFFIHLFWVVPLSAAPRVDALSIQEIKGDLKTIKVLGANFGEKAQAAPVLFDFGDHAFENGKINSVNRNSGNGAIIVGSADPTISLWRKPSRGAGHLIQYTNQQKPRDHGDPGHYYFKGADAFLGWPNAYGGFDTPLDNPQLYISWRYKPKFNPKAYWAFSPEKLSGQFIELEDLAINGRTIGKYIGVDTDGLINAELPNLTSGDLAGQTLTGQKSGATVQFPLNFRGGSGAGYETPGSQKYLRVWEDPSGKEGIRYSWTQMHQTGMGIVKWEARPLKGGEWHHMEVALDTQQGQLSAYLDGENFTNLTFSRTEAVSGRWSPTIALLGLDGKVGKLQESEIDNIYMDSSLQRIVIADNEDLSKSTNYELQMIRNWSNNEVVFELNLGALDNENNLYVFVFDKNGVPSPTGIALCSECGAPPSSINLQIH